MWRVCWDSHRIAVKHARMLLAIKSGWRSLWINHKTLAIIETSEILKSEPSWCFWLNRWNQELKVQQSGPFSFIGIRRCAVLLFLCLHSVKVQSMWNPGSEAEKWRNVSITTARKMKFAVGQCEHVYWKFLSWVKCWEKVKMAADPTQTALVESECVDSQSWPVQVQWRWCCQLAWCLFVLLASVFHPLWVHFPPTSS